MHTHRLMTKLLSTAALPAAMAQAGGHGTATLWQSSCAHHYGWLRMRPTRPRCACMRFVSDQRTADAEPAGRLALLHGSWICQDAVGCCDLNSPRPWGCGPWPRRPALDALTLALPTFDALMCQAGYQAAYKVKPCVRCRAFAPALPGNISPPAN